MNHPSNFTVTVRTIDVAAVQVWAAGMEGLLRELRRTENPHVLHDGLELVRRQGKTVDELMATVNRRKAA